ncbi:MAG: hypothetical protein WC551_08630 [Patescibacteria group bacterium]
MTDIYLVEGSWQDYEDEAHWAVAVFSDAESAESCRRECQEYIEAYCKEFWAAFAQEFNYSGEPNFEAAFLGYGYDVPDRSTVETMHCFAEAWFDKATVRERSPDPNVETLRMEPCNYCVVMVPFNPSRWLK